MAGWRKNFGLLTVLTGTVATVYVQTYPHIVLVGFPVGLLVVFLLCFPFVTENKARQIAEKVAQKKYPTVRVVIQGAKLDNWTWHIHGVAVEKTGFRIDVNAKYGCIIRENYGQS